jgi:hypothetical protein
MIFKHLFKTILTVKVMKKYMNLQVEKERIFTMSDWFIQGLVAVVLAFLLVVVSSGKGFGQVSQLETDKGIAASIAPYNADVRLAILQASQYPQILTQMKQTQANSEVAFQNMISDFRQKKQGWFYTLTRYPDLTHKLATLPDGQDKDNIYRFLPNQDPDLQEAAWKLYKHEKEDLVAVDNLNVAAQQEFNKSIDGLDNDTKASFNKLGKLPDVLTLLTNNIDLTTKLGGQYKDNPTALNTTLTALHDSLNVQNQYEIAAFKKQLADNPQAQQEMSQAAQDYAKANGFNLPTQQGYNGNNNGYNNSNYYNNPYSYWFGYPSWYGSPLWYPNSFGYNSGFYYGGGLGIGFGMYGFPSYGFSNWFFNGGYYNRYPRLYNTFGNYYRTNIGQGRVMGSVNSGFMGIANNHFNPNGGARMNYMNSANGYTRPAGQNYQGNGNTTHSNANSYHAQSWGGNSGGYGGGGRGFGGGGGGRGGGRH